MKLDDAIQHLYEMLNDSMKEWSCDECRQEHVELLNYLLELKFYRSQSDLIHRDSIMPACIKKAKTMKDRHGVKLGETWLLDYEDIEDAVNNIPTVKFQLIVQDRGGSDD